MEWGDHLKADQTKKGRLRDKSILNAHKGSKNSKQNPDIMYESVLTQGDLFVSLLL